MTSTPANRVRELNDAFRKAWPTEDWHVSSGLEDEGLIFCLVAMGMVHEFHEFFTDNDPHSEHDFASFTLDGLRLFWKIDYYDPSLECRSKNPAAPAITRRVLTIMLASEY